MSSDQNKSIVRRYLDDVWGKGQVTLLPQLVEEGVCDHAPFPGQPHGLEGQYYAVDALRRSFSKFTVEVVHLIAEGDLVVDHWISTGVHTGELFGMQPTGRPIKITGSDMYRMAGGKIAEIWHAEDMVVLMQQLGMMPMATETQPQTSRERTTYRGTSTSGTRLSPDDRRDLIRDAYAQFIDRADLSQVDTLLTPDYVGHFSGFPTVYGRDGFRQYLSMWNQAIRPNHAQVDDIILDGDMAACRVAFMGKHTGEMMGVAATGNPVKSQGVSLFRFAGDQVAEQWANEDDLSVLQQIGMVPAMAGAEMPSPC